MDGVLALLGILSLICLVVAVIKPSIFKLQSRWKAFFIFLGIFLVLTFLFGLTQETDSNQNQAGQQSLAEQEAEMAADAAMVGTANESSNVAPDEVTEQPQQQTIEVTAQQLYEAYQQNEIAANQQFKDKQLLVHGVVDSIEADFMDKPVINLRAGDEYNFLLPSANLADEELNKAATLSKGQTVSLLCVGGSEVIGAPVLNDCYLQ
ncbi:tRNA_anti-like [Acinetobacter marinus]|uniref:tRNA_anti-like n=1 Tax=Acinetobacter marinus TaxID=281375 RepID=A0A1G6JBP2_9GAMM|nr:hypothetical protein [Acinetobacter marinus]SDC16161.1 tRNA_anti-like [Acinetobacter marinus]